MRLDRCLGLVVGLAAAALAGATSSMAQPAPAEIDVELNKLEPVDNACRIYLVLQNHTADSYDKLALELVSFGPDGLVGQRLAIDVAPLRAGKTTVKLFDLPRTNCGQVARLLVNDVSTCSAQGAAIENCLDRLKVSTRAAAELFK